MHAYPQIYLVDNNKLYKYSGDRTIEGLVPWIDGDYKELESIPVYTDIPTATENFFGTFRDIYTQLKISYKINKTGTVLFVSILGILILLFFSVVVSIIYDVYKLRK